MSAKKASLEDFFIEEDGTNSFMQYCQKNSTNQNKNYTTNDVVIAKNQKEFGHKKRIKP